MTVNNMDIERIQGRLLEMAKKIAGVFEDNEIPYFITYGTLLGAVRHGGFIPWDDDFDFFLFDEGYSDAVSILREELPETMFVEDEHSEPLYFHGWAHVKDLHSIAISSAYPHDNIYKHNGISIDLYIAKRMRLSEVEEWIKRENDEYLKRRKQSNCISQDEYNKRMNQKRKSAFNGTDNQRVIDRDVLGTITSYQTKSIELEDVFPLKKIKFEDTMFFAPHFPEKLLSNWYGDYMTLPPQNERRGHYDYVEFLK